MHSIIYNFSYVPLSINYRAHRLGGRHLYLNGVDVTGVRFVAGRSVVKLSPMCFVEPYNYTEQVITDDMLQQFDNYLRRRTTYTSFTVMVLTVTDDSVTDNQNYRCILLYLIAQTQLAPDRPDVKPWVRLVLRRTPLFHVTILATLCIKWLMVGRLECVKRSR